MSGEIPDSNRVRGDYMNAHADAQRGTYDWILQDPEPKTAAPAATPAAAPAEGAAPAAAATVDPGAPLGLRIESAITSTMKAAGERYVAGIAGAWDKLKSDYVAQQNMNHEVATLPFWDSLKKEFEATVAAGKLYPDAFNLVTSPLTSAIGTATHGAAVAAHEATGGDARKHMSVEDYENMFNSALMAIGPGKGGLGAAAKAGKVAGELPPGGAGAAAKPAPIATAAAEMGAVPEAPGAAAAAGEAPKAPVPAVTEETPPAFTFDGRAPGKSGAFRITDEDRAKATDYLAGKNPNNPIQASLESLAKDETMNQAIADVARFIPKGAVKPDDVLEMGAYSIQMTPERILAGMKSAGVTDEEIGAHAMLINSGARELKAASEAYAADPSPENLETFARTFALQNKIEGDWQAIGTAQGRAFRARQLAWDARSDLSKTLQEVITNTGTGSLEEAARKIASLEDPEKVSALTGALRKMSSRDGVLFGWFNILLSNTPKTLLKKLSSDAFTAMFNVATRKLAESDVPGGVPRGEWADLLYGYINNLGDGLRGAWRGLKSGESQFQGEYNTIESGTKYRAAELAKGMATDGEPETATAAAWRYLRAALPTSWIGAADDFAKIANYGAAKQALIFRKVAAEGGDEAAMAMKRQKLLSNVPDDIHGQAVAEALKYTYQEPLSGIAEKIKDMADAINIPIVGTNFKIPLGRIILPFVKIPANLERFAYRNSPLAAVFPSEPLTAELRAGGARASIAKAGMVLGTGVSMFGITMSLAGRLTGHGPTNPQLRRAWLDAGNQPYSVKFGDTWYTYNSVEPLGLMLGPIGDTADIMRFASDKDGEQAAWSLAFGIGQALLSPSYMMGMGEFMDALQRPDEDAKNYGENLLLSIAVPQGVAAIAKANDPWRRAHYNLLEAAEARTPGLSKDLPPQRTLWGDAIPWADGYLPGLSGTGLARAISPVQMRDATKVEPIDRWIFDNRLSFPQGDEGRLGLPQPGRFYSFSSGGVSAQIELNAKEVDRLRVLAGNGLKDPRTKMGAKDTLNALVTGKYPDKAVQERWNAASPELKASQIQTIWSQFRGAAKKQLYAEDANVRSQIDQALGLRAKALTAGPASAPAGAAQPAAASGPIKQPQFGGR